MSRVRCRADLKFLIIDDHDGFQGKDKNSDYWFTRNVVIRQLWDFKEAMNPPIPRNQRQPPPQAHLEASVSSYPPSVFFKKFQHALFSLLLQDFSPEGGDEELNPSTDQDEVREAMAAFLEDEAATMGTAEGLRERLSRHVREAPVHDDSTSDDSTSDESEPDFSELDDLSDGFAMLSDEEDDNGSPHSTVYTTE